MSNTKRVAGLLIGFALAGFLLAGCSAPATSRTTPTPTVSATLDASAAAKLAINGKNIGDALAPEQAKAVQHDWQGNAMAYQNQDGSFTLIDRTKPLPDSVKADVASRFSAAATASTDLSANDWTISLIKSSGYATGHNLVVVVQIHTHLMSNPDAIGWPWTAQGVPLGMQFDSPDAALQAARQYVESHGGDPATEYIVANR